MNKVGTYAIGGHKNSLAQRFSKGKRVNPELHKKKSETPGPGAYSDGLSVSKERDPNNDQ